MNIVEVNVSLLTPPEPMTVILENLARLSSHSILVVTHRRQPFPLYERLLSNDWCYKTVEVSSEYFKIYITRQIDRSLLDEVCQKHVL